MDGIAAKLRERFGDEAVAELERLMLQSVMDRAEIARLRLTAAEREAIEEAIKAFDEFAGDEVYVVALRTLLERTLPPHPTQSDGSLPSECA